MSNIGTARLTVEDMRTLSADEFRGRGISEQALADIIEIREEEAEDLKDYPTIVPPCPWWCTKEASHPYEPYSSVGDNGGKVWTRWHAVRETNASKAYVSQMEENENGVVRLLDQPIVSVWIGDGVGITAAEAAQAGADLLAAANDLNRVMSISAGVEL
jgi:hypothetical protein